MKHTNPLRQPSVFIAASLTLACALALAASLVMSATISGVVPSAGGDWSESDFPQPATTSR